MKKSHFDKLMQTLADMAHELPIDGGFQVSRLQRLKRLFLDGEAYREFVLMILAEVQAGVEKSTYSPLMPMADKIHLFEQVRQAINTNDLTQLGILNEQLFDLQPGWQRIWTHSSRRKGPDRQLILLEYAVKSFVDVASIDGLFGFQLVCLYLSSQDSLRFRFAADAAQKLLSMEHFWKNHPPLFTSPAVKQPRPETRIFLVNGLVVEPLPTPDTAAAQAAERIKRGELRYRPGDWVMHRYFGRGVIRTVSRSGQNLTASFEYRSDKQLSTEHSPMWPIPEPAAPRLEPVEPTGIVRQVYEEALRPVAGMVDDDALEEMEDPVQVKLAKAAYNLAKAKKHFSSFVKTLGITRFYEAGDDLSNTITRLKGAKNRACEAWLFCNGYTPTIYDDRDRLAGHFEERAPRYLLRKALLLEEKLTLLLYGNIYADEAFDGVVAPPEQRLEEVAVCLVEVEALYRHIKNGQKLGVFRWERENDLVPGSRVVHLTHSFIPYPDRNESVTHWISNEKLVIAVEGNEVIVRSPYRRKIERLHSDSLLLRSSARLPIDMLTPFEARRTWFDLRPQLRQVPLRLPEYVGTGESLHYAHDFGASIYFTCPCCGYPTKLTHPEYHNLHSEDDYGYYELCLLCDWVDCCYSDDGFDEKDVDDVNFNYTLLQARRNFEEHGSMFQPQDGVYHECHQTAAIVAAKQKLRAAFDGMSRENNKGRFYLLWWEAERARQKLIAELKVFEEGHVDSYTVPFDDEGDTIGRRFDYKWREVESIKPGSWFIDNIEGRARIVAVQRTPHGTDVCIRNNRRKVREIVIGGVSKGLEESHDFFWTPFYARRTWFETYPGYLQGNKPCPCCGYPLLTGERSFELCSLCEWVDDGQDDHDADEVFGGPNCDLSLTEARKNFTVTLCMFRSDDPELEIIESRRKGLLPWKQRIVGLYDRLITVDSASAAATLWTEIECCWEEARSTNPLLRSFLS